MHRRYMIVTTVMALLVSGLPLAAQSPTHREPRSSRDHQQAFKEFERGGIPAAAAVAGTYRTTESFGGIDIAENLTGLAWASHIVVIGRVQSEKSVLSGDQRHINTEMQLRIERLFKGADVLSAGREIVVSVPGGRVVFPNGTSAEALLTTGPMPMKTGGRYLLFSSLRMRNWPLKLAG